MLLLCCKVLSLHFVLLYGTVAAPAEASALLVSLAPQAKTLVMSKKCQFHLRVDIWLTRALHLVKFASSHFMTSLLWIILQDGLQGNACHCDDMRHRGRVWGSFLGQGHHLIWIPFEDEGP